MFKRFPYNCYLLFIFPQPWRRKFVAVHQNACTSGISLLFELYQDEFTYKQVACVLLNDITSVKRCTSKTNRHAFAVLSPRRQLYLAADSETDAIEWVAMLRKFMVKKPVKREPPPAESEDDDVFNISIIPNDHSERLELYENYRLTTDSPHLCLYNSRSAVVLQLKLANLKRFMLTKKCHEKDTDKILHISTNARCKYGECELILYTNRGKQLIAKILEQVTMNRHTRVSRRRSITSSMIFDITPEDLARLGTISESSSSQSDEDAIKSEKDTASEQSGGSDTLVRDVRPKDTNGVKAYHQESPTLQKCTTKQPRTPTVGKPVLKKRRAPPPPASTSPTSSDRRQLEYSPSIASSTSTVSTVTSVPEDDRFSESSKTGTIKASPGNGSGSSTSPKEERAFKGAVLITPKPSPPRPKYPPKLSPMLQAKYKTGSVETIYSNKENRFNSPPGSPISIASTTCSFSSEESSPPIPPRRRRRQKNATLERCTNIHTETTKQPSPKLTLKQIANGEVPNDLQTKASTLQRPLANNSTLAQLPNGGIANYNNNSSTSSEDSDSDGFYSDNSDDVTAGNWYYDIRPYINTAEVNVETKDGLENLSLAAEVNQQTNKT
ncbi:mucin-5AC-like [Anneissia japonica]|uniref:mucin-5AC-like n=1 Tax=Anneissia japonica TaxID=1529436 RepID=UPI001425AADD|nr:mucin-5AC-like [Anneissia japonica]